MANGVLKLYPAMSGDTRPGVPAVITQTVDLADRRDAAPPALSALRLGALPDRGGLKFSSEVFKQPLGVSEIGRASCRERVGKSVEISVCSVSLKKKR